MANLSQQRRQRMLDFLQKVRDKNKDDDEALVAIGEIENEITEKKYGLVWEEHSEEVEERMVEEVPVFVEDKDKEITLTEDGYNFLLEGDNLHSLHLLEKTHKEKIDVIYIDPPYNTESGEFVYDDCRVDDNDAFRHSKWLSFIERRLIVAKNLLARDGVIFVSIDDNELCNLKALMDSIFTEDNLIANIVVASNSAKNNSKYISVGHEYMLCYANDKASLSGEWQVRKNNVDEYKKRAMQLVKRGIPEEEIHSELLELTKYPRFYDFDHFTYADSRGVYETDNPGGVKNGNTSSVVYHPVTGKPCRMPNGGWRYKEEELNRLANEGLLEFGEDETIIPRVKRYLDDYLTQVPKSILFFDSQSSTKWLKSNGFEFDFPKATSLIRHILSIFKSDATILDFFAGSGTTGQAVLELNKEDGGNRKFILCTNNENNICEGVTYPRLQTVITGVRQDGNKYSDGIPANLKYYKTDYIPKKSDNLSADLIKHIDEMIQLEYHVKIDKDKYISVLTDEDADELEKNWQNFPNIRAIYISRSVLLTGKQRELFETKDCFVIPDYYFREELRDAGEA